MREKRKEGKTKRDERGKEDYREEIREKRKTNEKK